MYMTFGEFCELLGIEQRGPDAFAFWLRSHLMTPSQCERIVEKRKSELAAGK